MQQFEWFGGGFGKMFWVLCEFWRNVGHFWSNVCEIHRKMGVFGQKWGFFARFWGVFGPNLHIWGGRRGFYSLLCPKSHNSPHFRIYTTHNHPKIGKIRTKTTQNCIYTHPRPKYGHKSGILDTKWHIFVQNRVISRENGLKWHIFAHFLPHFAKYGGNMPILDANWPFLALLWHFSINLCNFMVIFSTFVSNYRIISPFLIIFWWFIQIMALFVLAPVQWLMPKWNARYFTKRNLWSSK